MNIKLIGFDLDDTLLKDNKEISIENKKAIKKVIDKGVKIVFASGRPFVAQTVKYYRDLDLVKNDVYYVAYNGEAIYNVGTGECIYSNNLSEKDIAEIDGYFCDLDITRYIHRDNCVVSSRIDKYVSIEADYNMLRIDEREFVNDGFGAHKYMIGADEKVIRKLFDSLPKELTRKYNIVISLPFLMEVYKKDVDKYEGLLKVARKYGIGENEIMAFGDSMNDIGMIKRAAIGVAMGNSKEYVKKEAYYVTDTNERDGVAKALNKFIFEGKK